MALLLTSCQAAVADPGVAAVAEYLGRALCTDVRFVGDADWRERKRSFDSGEIDVAWICGTPYIRMVARSASIELLGAPVFAGHRYGGRPVYFSDVMVQRDSSIRSFEDLRGQRVACNNVGSYSGYEVLRYALAKRDLRGDFFGRVVCSGAHERSMRLIAAGLVDAAAIDTTVIDGLREVVPELCDELRPIEVLGPSPQPPWVVGTHVPEDERARLREALVHMHEENAGVAALRQAGLVRFSEVVDGDYDEIRRVIAVADAASIVF